MRAQLLIIMIALMAAAIPAYAEEDLPWPNFNNDPVLNNDCSDPNMLPFTAVSDNENQGRVDRTSLSLMYCKDQAFMNRRRKIVT